MTLDKGLSIFKTQNQHITLVFTASIYIYIYIYIFIFPFLIHYVVIFEEYTFFSHDAPGNTYCNALIKDPIFNNTHSF